MLWHAHQTRQTVVLSPEWVNRYISDVLDSAAVDSAHGLLTHAEMTRLWADLDRGMRDHFLLCLCREHGEAYRRAARL